MTKKSVAAQQSIPYAIHNDLIQKSIFSMSLQQLRITLYMISKIKPKDDISTLYDISIKEYCEVCNIDYSQGWHYANVKKSLDEIDKIRIWIVDTDKNGKTKRTRIQWFHRLIINDGSGNIEYSFNEDMRQYLFSLEGRYLLAHLEYILPMSSKYSIRLYNLLKSVQNMRTVQEDGFHISLADFKLRLDAENYDRFPDLRRRVIERGLKDINEFTDIDVSVKTEKINSKSVNQLTFDITEPLAIDAERRRDKRLLALGNYNIPEIERKYGMYSKKYPPNLPEIFKEIDGKGIEQQTKREESPEEVRERIRNKLRRAAALNIEAANAAREAAEAYTSDFDEEPQEE